MFFILFCRIFQKLKRVFCLKDYPNPHKLSMAHQYNLAKTWNTLTKLLLLDQERKTVTFLTFSRSIQNHHLCKHVYLFLYKLFLLSTESKIHKTLAIFRNPHSFRQFRKQRSCSNLHQTHSLLPSCCVTSAQKLNTVRV